MKSTNLKPKPSAKKIKQLYDDYLLLVTREVIEFGVKPTEVRHLIGRLGEFFCAITVKGTLALQANQPGYDVISKAGRKISVKTTAQKTGFIIISEATIEHADDLMVIQYTDGKLEIIYHDCIDKACQNARFYKELNRYNLDIAKAKSLFLAGRV